LPRDAGAEGVARCIASMEALADLVDCRAPRSPRRRRRGLLPGLRRPGGIARTAHPEVQWRSSRWRTPTSAPASSPATRHIALAAELPGDRAPNATRRYPADGRGDARASRADPDADDPPLDLTNEELALPCSRCVSRGKIDVRPAAAGMGMPPSRAARRGDPVLHRCCSRVAVLSGYTTFDMRGDGRVRPGRSTSASRRPLHPPPPDFHRGDLFLGFRRVCVDLSREIKIG
jgi:hypothetical protein